MDYSRQLKLDFLSPAGQAALSNSRVAVFGAGGLGCAVLPYLAGAGVGHLTIIDPDNLEAHNLHRQILYTPNNVGQSKAQLAADRLSTLNTDCACTAVCKTVDGQALATIFDTHDLIVDCTDDHAFSLQLNQWALTKTTPIVFANASQMQGQLFVFNGDARNACLCCLWGPEAPLVESCDALGVLGPVPGTLGSLQAIESIKLLLNHPQAMPLRNTLINYSFLDHHYHRLAVVPDAQCAHHLTLNSNSSTPARLKSFTGELSTAVKQGFSIIDICHVSERSQPLSVAHALIPLEQLANDAQYYLDDETPYLLVCKTGKRSHSLQRLLQDKGYDNITTFYPQT